MTDVNGMEMLGMIIDSGGRFLLARWLHPEQQAR
jgi:hypothetical protein